MARSIAYSAGGSVPAGRAKGNLGGALIAGAGTAVVDTSVLDIMDLLKEKFLGIKEQSLERLGKWIYCIGNNAGR